MHELNDDRSDASDEDMSDEEFGDVTRRDDSMHDTSPSPSFEVSVFMSLKVAGILLLVWSVMLLAYFVYEMKCLVTDTITSVAQAFTGTFGHSLVLEYCLCMDDAIMQFPVELHAY